eukprot:jgi/Botrbrau1/1015/Bobra.114_1s0053.1
MDLDLNGSRGAFAGNSAALGVVRYSQSPEFPPMGGQSSSQRGPPTDPRLRAKPRFAAGTVSPGAPLAGGQPGAVSLPCVLADAQAGRDPLGGTGPLGTGPAAGPPASGQVSGGPSAGALGRGPPSGPHRPHDLFDGSSSAQDVPGSMGPDGRSLDGPLGTSSLPATGRLPAIPPGCGSLPGGQLHERGDGMPPSSLVAAGQGASPARSHASTPLQSSPAPVPPASAVPLAAAQPQAQHPPSGYLSGVVPPAQPLARPHAQPPACSTLPSGLPPVTRQAPTGALASPVGGTPPSGAPVAHQADSLALPVPLGAAPARSGTLPSPLLPVQAGSAPAAAAKATGQVGGTSLPGPLGRAHAGSAPTGAQSSGEAPAQPLSLPSAGAGAGDGAPAGPLLGPNGRDSVGRDSSHNGTANGPPSIGPPGAQPVVPGPVLGAQPGSLIQSNSRAGHQGHGPPAPGPLGARETGGTGPGRLNVGHGAGGGGREADCKDGVPNGSPAVAPGADSGVCLMEVDYPSVPGETVMRTLETPMGTGPLQGPGGAVCRPLKPAGEQEVAGEASSGVVEPAALQPMQEGLEGQGVPSVPGDLLQKGSRASNALEVTALQSEGSQCQVTESAVQRKLSDGPVLQPPPSIAAAPQAPGNRLQKEGPGPATVKPKCMTAVQPPEDVALSSRSHSEAMAEAPQDSIPEADPIAQVAERAKAQELASIPPQAWQRTPQGPAPQGDAAREMDCPTCLRRFHWGCLSAKDQQEVAGGKEPWFCTQECRNVSLNLARVCHQGVVPCGVMEDGTPVGWQLIRGAAVAAPKGCRGYAPHYGKEAQEVLRVVLHAVRHVAADIFGKIQDFRSPVDLLPALLAGNASLDRTVDFSSFHTAALWVGGSLTSLALVRVLGEEAAEIPIIATRRELRGNGLARILLRAVEGTLLDCGCRLAVMPSALVVPAPRRRAGVVSQETHLPSAWPLKVGYEVMTLVQSLRITGLPTLSFPGTTLLSKELVRDGLTQAPSVRRLALFPGCPAQALCRAGVLRPSAVVTAPASPKQSLSKSRAPGPRQPVCRSLPRSPRPPSHHLLWRSRLKESHPPSLATPPCLYCWMYPLPWPQLALCGRPLALLALHRQPS